MASNCPPQPFPSLPPRWGRKMGAQGKGAQRAVSIDCQPLAVRMEISQGSASPSSSED